MSAPLIEAVDLVRTYRSARAGLFGGHSVRRAVAGVSFAMQAGRSFGVVGESGSGKSTLARLVLAIDRPDAGAVRLEGRALFEMSRRELRLARQRMQMIFQDPYGSLDPRMRVARIVAEPLAALERISRDEARARVAAALEAVGLSARDATKYPHEFSGGQRQRIAIARALITRPKLVVADEPVSALDVSIQAQVLNLMSDLQRDSGVAFLLISHDLSVVGHICETTAVMFRGRFVEIGPSAAVFDAPAHPYARELVDATPRLDRAPRAAAARRAPAPAAQNGGCAYAARCPFAQSRCLEEDPPLRPVGPEGSERRTACHYPLI